MRAGAVRVLVYVTDSADQDAVLRAYHRISRELSGTPGLIGNELLTSVHDGASHVVVSYWADLAAFRAWEEGADHRNTTSPLRPYQTPGMRAGIYEVAAAYDETAAGLTAAAN